MHACLQITYDPNSPVEPYSFDPWQVDRMEGGRRVMGDAVLLPNGKVIVLNGAQVRGQGGGWVGAGNNE